MGVDDAVDPAGGVGGGESLVEGGDSIEGNIEEFGTITQAEVIRRHRGGGQHIEIFSEFGAELEDAVGDGISGESVFFHLFLD